MDRWRVETPLFPKYFCTLAYLGQKDKGSNLPVSPHWTWSQVMATDGFQTVKRVDDFITVVGGVLAETHISPQITPDRVCTHMLHA